MASVITATTTSGLTQSADNSGVLQLASGTGNLVTVPSVTGTAMVSGNMPAFSAIKTSNQSITQSTWTKITFDSEQFDTASCYSSSRFTPNVAGYYVINCNIFITTPSTSSYIQHAIYKNGSLFSLITETQVTTVSYVSVPGSVLIYLNGSTDYIEIYMNTGFNATAYGEATPYTYFQGYLVRAA
jgi:hypothetical protein